MGLNFSQGDPEPPEPAGCAIIQEKFRYSSAREIPNTRLPAVFLGFPGTITRVFHCASRRYPPGPPECPGGCPGHGGSSAPASAAGRCKSVPPPAFQSKLNRIPFNESNESSFFRQIRCGADHGWMFCGPSWCAARSWASGPSRRRCRSLGARILHETEWFGVTSWSAIVLSPHCRY